MPTPLLSRDVLDRFLDRVGRDLRREPFEMPGEEHRSRIAELFARCGSANHYELLEVGSGADEREIHSAYQLFARAVHPDHAAALGLDDRRGVLDLLFERATEAYLVLTEPHRRSEYDRRVGIERSRSPAVRGEETQRIAADLHTRARGLIEDGDLHFAHELLRQAVHADPEAIEIWETLAGVQARNPRWLHMAGDSLRRALRLQPQSPELRRKLAAVEERQGRPEVALGLYEQILERRPGDAGVAEAIKRLHAGPQPDEEKTLFGWLGRRRHPPGGG